MTESKRRSAANVEETEYLESLGHKSVLESPFSVVKMDISELRLFTNRLNDFLESPGSAAIRICECCINVD